MSLDLIINTNLIPFIGAVLLLAFACMNPLFDKRQTRLFIIAAIINLVMLAAISADYVFAKLDYDGMWAWRRVTSFLNFAACPLIPFLLLKIFEREKVSPWYNVPLITNAILCFISIFVNLIFFISEENTYGRGPLFFVPFITAIIYIVLLIVKPVTKHAKSRGMERMFLFAIIGFLVLCMFFEVALGYRFLAWDCSVLGLILYYLLLTIHCFIVDPLTGAYNRLPYSRRLAGLGGRSHYLIAILDINDFKQVNDLYGHDAGDAFLIKFVQIVSRHLPKGATLYRIGGDEFSILSKNMDRAKFASHLEDAREEAGRHDISFACGIAEYHPHHNIDDVLKQADSLMYQNKSEIKAHSV